MTKEYFFSVNLLIKSDTNLKKAIESVISDVSFFKEHIQLLLIDLIGSELSLSVFSEYSSKYPENVLYIDAVGKSETEGYNDAHNLCMGKYISYIDNLGEYANKALPMMYPTLQSGKIPILALKPFVISQGGRKAYLPDIKAGIIKLNETPDKFILILGSYFFRKDVVSEIYFDSSLRFDYYAKLIAQVLVSVNSFLFTEKYFYNTLETIEKDKIQYEPQYSQMFYTPAVRDFIIPMLKEYGNSLLIQSMMMYLINIKFALNQNEFYKNVLIGSHVTDFFHICKEAFQYINDVVILNRRLARLCDLDIEVLFRFLRLKYDNNALFPQIDTVPPKQIQEYNYYSPNGKLNPMTLSGEFAAHIDGALVTRSKSISAVITAVNCDYDGIYIDARLSGCSCFDENEINIFASVNKVKTDVLKSNVYSITKFFDISFLKRYSFKFFIPIDRKHQANVISIHMKYKNISFRMKMEFEGVNSKLSDEVKSSYWHFFDRVLTYDHKNKCLVIRHASDSLLSLYENRFLSEISKKLSFRESLYYRLLRSQGRKLLRDKNGKKFMMFCENSGVNYNGNLLFRYFSKFQQRENAVYYMTVKQNSKEKIFLTDSGYENILEEGSRKSKAFVLASDMIIASESDIYHALGFTEKDKIYLRDMLNAKIISVKNSFLTYDTAHIDNRLYDNTQMVFCSSQREKDNISQSIYDYDKSMIHITGIPLLDAVSDNREKLILIAPGNRRLFGIYEYSDFYRFSNSAFFRSYNTVFSDPLLLEQCRKYGFKIAVLMPSLTEKYIKMFYSDDIVSLYTSSEQNETSLLSRASVLITDYSELQYKFAFLNKKIIYYFPPSLPMQSERRGEKIPQYGFGEMIFDTQKLIDKLIAEIPQDFPQTQKYALRREEFFQYKDHHSCQRIAEMITKEYLS